MSDQRLEALSRVPLFTKLSGRQLKKILKAASEDRYDAGTVMVRQGAFGWTLFVIMEGKAKVVRNGRTVGRRSEGDFFGEVSMIDGRPRAATVIAESPIRCLVLGHGELKKVVAAEPRAAWAMLESMAASLRDE